MYRNISLSTLSTIIRIILNISVVAIFTHALPIDIFSYYALGLFIAQGACVVIDAGVNTEIMRFARIEDNVVSDARLASSTIVRLILCGVITIACFIYSVTFSKRIYIIIFLMSVVSGVIASIVETYFVNIKAKNLFKKEILCVAGQAIILLSFSSLSFISLWLVPIAIITPRVIVLYLLSVKDGDLMRNVTTFRFEDIKLHFFRLKYYSIDSIFSNFGMQIDNLLIVGILGKDVYAIYQPLSRLYNAALALAGSIGAYVVPQASTCPGSRGKWKLLQVCFVCSGIIVSSGFFLFASQIVTHFFGRGYLNTSSVVTILSLILIIRFAASGAGSFLTLVGKQKLRAVINAILTIIGFVVGLALGRGIESILTIICISQLVLLIVYMSFSLSLSYKVKAHE